MEEEVAQLDRGPVNCTIDQKKGSYIFLVLIIELKEP